MEKVLFNSESYYMEDGYYNDAESVDYNNVVNMIEELPYNYGYLAKIYINRWNGQSNGYEHYDDFDKLVQDICKDCGNILITKNDDYISVGGTHHDGGAGCDVYILTSDGESLAEDYYDFIKTYDDILSCEKMYNDLFAVEDRAGFQERVLKLNDDLRRWYPMIPQKEWDKFYNNYKNDEWGYNYVYRYIIDKKMYNKIK